MATTRKMSEPAVFGPAKFGTALRRLLAEKALRRRAEPHQTFSWLVVMLEQWLEDETRGVDLEGVSASPQKRLRTMALEVLQTLFSLRKRENMIVKPASLALCIRELIPDDQVASQFLVVLKLEFARYLERSRSASLDDIPAVLEPKERRAPNRAREELPDPSQPAWASVNRLPSENAQVSARLEPHVKAMLVDAAKDLGLSQAAWLEMIIVSQLRYQGYDARRTRIYKASPAPLGPRRTRRAALPEPTMSPDASVNRADKTTSMRVTKSLAREMDRIRAGKLDRSEWLNVAVRDYLASKERLPGADTRGEPLSELFSVRFDKDLFQELEKAIKKSGLTNSEWFRRAARWKLQKDR